ncbi:MAG: hypothetical protein JWM41_3017 [Gemmatimonadetes bacterium]|nr:hypothetical protein [Gemmatimonadota bacterium]
MPATFFKSGRAFREWLEKHHTAKTELLLGFHKKDSGRGGITYQEALDEALAFGWIDGIRRRIDDYGYSIRFTPRKPRSIWSAVNIKRVNELTAAGRMRDAGCAAFEKRDETRSAVYAYEQREGAVLDAVALKALKADKKAWKFYDAQPPFYQRTSAYWINSAKKPETRAKRLATLIDCSRKGERIPPLAFPSAAKKPNPTA